MHFATAGPLNQRDLRFNAFFNSCLTTHIVVGRTRFSSDKRS